MFLGRETELESLKRLQRLPKASLVVCRGRRRIGKSTLIEKFAEGQNFWEFQGLPPHESQPKGAALAHFCEQISQNLSLPKMTFASWLDAFIFLSSQIPSKKTVILLDEISWMSAQEKDFVGYLKVAWDMHFKKNQNLILVLCGSVSSWIDENILNSTGMMGRVSLTISLKELSLVHCNEFWNQNTSVSDMDKLKILSVTGGVPRYLEEIDPSVGAEENISNLCFSPSGILFDEYEKIFNDIFSKKSATYRRIIESLIDGPKTMAQICEFNGLEPNGTYSQYCDELASSGFIGRYYVYSIASGKKTKLSTWRLIDNYVRFYLKYIEPRKDQLLKGMFVSPEVEQFLAINTIMGLQFENLVLGHLHQLMGKLQIHPSSVLSASPYFQNKTLRKPAVQIDLLIHTKTACYICEMKFGKTIKKKVIDEVREKRVRLNVPKELSCRTVLIYVGQFKDLTHFEENFDHLIYFPEFLKRS